MAKKPTCSLQLDQKFVGLAGWQVENLVTRTTDIFLEEHVNPQKALEILIKEVERASGELQSEASLIFPMNELAAQEQIWKQLGYEKRTPETLGVQAWQDSATESIPQEVHSYLNNCARIVSCAQFRD